MKKISKKIIYIILIVLMLSVPVFSTIVIALQDENDSNKEVTMHVYTEWTNEKDKDKKAKEDEIFYSDSFFDHSANEYNPHLATLSINMAKYSMNPGDPRGTGDQEWYANQPNRVKKFFEMIGFGEFQANADYTTRTDFDTIGVAAASKKIGDYTVIGIVPRSGGYFREWANNVYLGDGSKSDYMHEGWYNAANKLLTFLNEYVTSKNITGKVKLWIAGYSRGGATANIAAGLLDNKIANNEKIFNTDAELSFDRLYAYTFEAPQGANINSQTVKPPKDAIYNNIWNVINPNDFITKVAMSEWGFTRFGTDKFIVTDFYDIENAGQNERTFRKLYELHNIDPYKGRILVMGGLLGEDKTKVNYDGNILSIILLEEIVNQIGTRQKYADIYQKGMSDALLKVMSDANYDRIPIEDIIGDSLLVAAGLPPKNAAIKEALDPAALSLLLSVFKEKPNDVVSFGVNIKNLMDNHATGVSVAHLKAQDSYYVDYYNKDKKDIDKIKIVPLIDNADIGRISLFGYNDYLLTEPLSATGKYKEPFDGEKVNSKDLKGHIYVKGSVLDSSSVKKCDYGYAVGYYSYITEEKGEIFFPINKKVGLYAKSYSKKPYHTVELTVFRHNLSHDKQNPYKRQIDSHKETGVVFNSDFYYAEYSV